MTYATLLGSMMKRQIVFPNLENIEQVREAIKGRPEFIEAKKEYKGHTFYVFNYMVGHVDSFDCPIRRECRGLIFGADGKVLSRRFHKFFNLSEKPETFIENLDWTADHVIQAKMDGSMITPLVFDANTIAWATKMGVTDIGELAGRIADDRYNNFALYCRDNGVTPIFEYVGPYNRIVVPYQRENLVLLAVRNNCSGEYMHPDMVDFLAMQYKIPSVERSGLSIEDIAAQQDIEGVVVAFNCGMKVKVKCEWYCAIHRAKENLLFEKNILKMILEEKIDDVLPFLMEEDRKRTEAYMASVLEQIDKVTAAVDVLHEQFHSNNIDRKEFALTHAPKMDKFMTSLVFSTWGMTKNLIRQKVIALYLKNTSCQTDVDSIRKYIGTTWIPLGTEDGNEDSRAEAA